MEHNEKKSVKAMESPDIKSGEQMAIKARLVIESKYPQYKVLDSTHSTGFLTITLQCDNGGNQDFDRVKEALDNMMEDEFSCSPNTIRHTESYQDFGLVYTLPIPDYIEKWFANNKW